MSNDSDSNSMKGKSGQSFTPAWASELSRSDGKKSVSYGGDEGRGHSVRLDSDTIVDFNYARTMRGRVLLDDSK